MWSWFISQRLLIMGHIHFQMWMEKKPVKCWVSGQKVGFVDGMVTWRCSRAVWGGIRAKGLEYKTVHTVVFISPFSSK